MVILPMISKMAASDGDGTHPVGVAIDFDTAPPSRGSARCGWISAVAAIWKSSSRCSIVAVEPNRKYHFHAYMETEGITTESGMRFSINRPESQQCGEPVDRKFHWLPQMDRLWIWT